MLCGLVAIALLPEKPASSVHLVESTAIGRLDGPPAATLFAVHSLEKHKSGSELEQADLQLFASGCWHIGKLYIGETCGGEGHRLGPGFDDTKSQWCLFRGQPASSAWEVHSRPCFLATSPSILLPALIYSVQESWGTHHALPTRHLRVVRSFIGRLDTEVRLRVRTQGLSSHRWT